MSMTPKQLGITPTQYKNIEKLIAYGESVALTFHVFDMNVFFAGEDRKPVIPNKSVRHYETECGTTACFAGLGPLAGVSARGHTNWWDYIEQKFGMASCLDGYKWMFHHDWRNHNNTLAGACERARIFLESGIPEDWFFYDYTTWKPYST